MANELYYKSKRILNKYYLLMLIILVIVITMFIPIPYIIETPGDLINTNSRIILNTKYKQNGSFNITSVSEKKAIIFTYLRSLVNNNWDAYEKEEKENDKTGKLLLNNSISNATLVAYTSLQKDLEITESNVLVAYISENSKTDLEIGDVIKEVNNVAITNEEDYVKIVKKAKVGDKLVIKTDKEEKNIEVQEKDKENNTYIYIITNNKYNPDLKTTFDKTETGASAGLMIALSIYDKLSESNLANGKVIAGTGTIDALGNIGAVDGIKYKLAAAYQNNADIFLVPYDNYIEARKYLKINNYDFKLESIKTFNDAVEYLKSEK